MSGYAYPHRRETRERPHPKLYGRKIREATCVVCGRWFRVVIQGRLTCGPECAQRGREIRAGNDSPVRNVPAARRKTC